MKLDDAFGIHEQTLKLRAQRSETLAANLANTDTPGYKARDFDFGQVLRQEAAVRPVRLVSTHPSHIRAKQGVLAPTQLQYRVPQQPSLDGNTVEVDSEHSRFSTNALQYQASLRFLEDRIKGLRTAIKGA